MSTTLQFNLSGRSALAPTLFGAINPELRAELLAGAPLREVADGQIIQQRGDASAGFWVIERGRVRIGRYLASGEFRGIAVLVSGDSWGELAVLARNMRAVDAVADGAAQLRCITASAFEDALRRDPASLRQLTGALAEELQEVLGLLAVAGKDNNDARVAAMLANLAGAGEGPSTIMIGQQELGELLGLTRVTINKMLRELERQGLIERGYRKIRVADRQNLRNASVGD